MKILDNYFQKMKIGIELFRKKLKLINNKDIWQISEAIYEDNYFKKVAEISFKELQKEPKRTEVINFLIQLFERETIYLEIGVRNPNDNFNRIISNKKYSVDPGIEFPDNPVDFKMTSDTFFELLHKNKVLTDSIRFDVVFIDGLHIANQVERDIRNSLKFLSEDGFIVLHDCNPPTEFHCREDYYFRNSPARYYWNGTTWKAFYKFRLEENYSSCCIDSDFGIGIISKIKYFEPLINDLNPFYDYSVLNKYRKESLNLINFQQLQKFLIN